ncbi:MAG: lipopolysaccharide kinase InaA family protein [Syntrophales bacterium]|jgi:tRNA A-37 threonylcarbamoyl transferase component Bud32|nr:lipopolysaccharide kinase InaA family protein [Syntrophales bacterium]NLN59384.1 hypothetical protein [Deltaproteobacteria bacterium]
MPVQNSSHNAVHFIRKGHFKIWYVNSRKVSPLLGRMLPNPEAVFGEANVLFGQGSGCEAFHTRLSGHDYFLKRYSCPGWWYRLKNAFRRSRARRVWSLSHRLLRFGLPVARPLILFEERRYRLLGPAYLVTEFLSDHRTLTDLWNTIGREEQDVLVRHTATALAQIHKRGYIHGDTNWDNILFNSQAITPKIRFVDLDCARRFLKFSYKRAERDLGHFVRDLERDCNQGADRVDLFVSTWRSVIKKQPSRDRPDDTSQSMGMDV